MNRYLATLALLAASTATTGGAQGGGRPFPARGFDAVDLTGADDVRIVTGPATSVVATGDPRAIDALAIDVRGGVLTIGRRPGRWRDKGALITVTMPTIRAASITGSGNLTASGVGGAQLAASVAGSGTMRLVALRVRTMRIDLSGSGDVTADGRAEAVAIRLGGSGDIDTRRLATPHLAVDLAGSGGVRATASGTARINAGGSGEVEVTGGARCSVSKSGSADVSCG